MTIDMDKPKFVVVGKRVGFTGSQHGMNAYQRRECQKLITAIFVSEIHHGGCVGADAEFHILCAEVRPNVLPYIHPASDVDVAKQAWRYLKYGKLWIAKPALKRNHDIVNSTDLLIATPSQDKEILRSGTWATIRYAFKRHKPVYIVLPGGYVKRRPSAWRGSDTTRNGDALGSTANNNCPVNPILVATSPNTVQRKRKG